MRRVQRVLIHSALAASLCLVIAADRPTSRQAPPHVLAPKSQPVQVSKQTLNPWPEPMLVYWLVVLGLGLLPTAAWHRRRQPVLPSGDA